MKNHKHADDLKPDKVKKKNFICTERGQIKKN